MQRNQRLSCQGNATVWGVARQKFRGPKNRQLVKTVARVSSLFFPLFFSFSLIFKRKEESKDGLAQKPGVAKEAKTVAFQRKTVAGGSNKFNGLQMIATEPRFFSRYLLPSGLIGGGIACVRM
ncbi:hypothetical protein [Pandoraea communis]|uniref:hypothetical protein n=1 Tax=Pandoraea communis TaxID=2508297 RepID=UPI0025A5ECCE|nr:hypothetical protein [Pandoraea communis]MDM8358830.1 hypothetical protein [Pandoraea communis]